MDLKGIQYLRNKLNTVRMRGLMRYKYYETKYSHRMKGISIPYNIAAEFRTELGWCTKSVDNLADRLVVNGFENDSLRMNEIYSANNADILYDAAILGALINSCDFIYIQPTEPGYMPRMQVIDGTNATGVIDPVTYLLREGYAVLERDPENDEVILEAYFTPESTDYVWASGKVERRKNWAGIPLLVPIIYKPDSRRNFGHSRISRSCMGYQDAAEDILTRVNVMSEINSWPQKYVLGLSQNAEGIDTLKATVSSMLNFGKDEDGDHPVVGQFQQMSMAPHMDAFRLYASNFAGETGLTLDDLGFVQANPSSAEAIKASHEVLRVMAAKAQRDFEVGFVNAGYVAACLRNNFRFAREEAIKTHVIWKPVIEPDAAMLASIGDGAIKINNAVPGYFDAKTLEKLTGIESAGGESLGLFDFASEDN